MFTSAISILQNRPFSIAAVMTVIAGPELIQELPFFCTGVTTNVKYLPLPTWSAWLFSNLLCLSS